MIHRCIDPLPYPAPAETFWIQFIPEVPVHIVHDHEKKENVDMRPVQRHGKNKKWQYTSFQRVKSIGSPGRWIGAAVVNKMKIFEDTRMMHQPVYPVKISIVYHEHDGKRGKIPYPAIGVDRFVLQGKAGHWLVKMNRVTNKTKQADGDG